MSAAVFIWKSERLPVGVRIFDYHDWIFALVRAVLLLLAAGVNSPDPVSHRVDHPPAVPHRWNCL